MNKLIQFIKDISELDPDTCPSYERNKELIDKAKKLLENGIPPIRPEPEIREKLKHTQSIIDGYLHIGGKPTGSETVYSDLALLKWVLGE